MTTALDPGVIRRLADMHAVYRMFDHAGNLLYIGMTGRGGARFNEHGDRRWFPLVAMITLEWHETHAQAKLAETRAIAAERPRYNVAGTPVYRRRQAAVHAQKPAREEEPADILTEILGVFGEANALHWQVIADRLAARFPRRGITKELLSAQCRVLGVPSRQVKIGGRNQNGCRRQDLEEAAVRQLLGHHEGSTTLR